MRERSEIVAWIRGELVGPSRPLVEPALVEFADRDFMDPIPLRRGPLAWRPTPDAGVQEVLYFERETPHRKYGAGLLHPAPAPAAAAEADQAALQATDTIGAEPGVDENASEAPNGVAGGDDLEGLGTGEDTAGSDASDDFEVSASASMLATSGRRFSTLATASRAFLCSPSSA